MKKLLPRAFKNYYHSQKPVFKQNAEILFSKLKRQFLRPPLPLLADGTLNLNLGCGSINHPKFINIDGLPAPHIHYVRAIDNLAIFKDNSVNLIYGCHCLEHFPQFKLPVVLAEWFRVLNEGGILRLSVPDFDLILNIYSENGKEINTIVGPLMGGQDYKFNFHMSVFNRSNLESLLLGSGFKEVREWTPGSCELTTFDDWSNRKILINDKYYPVSLNLEAIK